MSSHSISKPFDRYASSFSPLRVLRGKEHITTKSDLHFHCLILNVFGTKRYRSRLECVAQDPKISFEVSRVAAHTIEFLGTASSGCEKASNYKSIRQVLGRVGRVEWFTDVVVLLSGALPTGVNRLAVGVSFRLWRRAQSNRAPTAHQKTGGSFSHILGASPPPAPWTLRLALSSMVQRARTQS